MFVRPLKRVRFDFRFFCWIRGCFLSRKHCFFCFFFLFFLVIEQCGRTAENNSVGPKLAVFRPFPRRKKVSPKKKWISRPRHHSDSMLSTPEPCLKKASLSYFTTLSNVSPLCRFLTPVCSSLKSLSLHKNSCKMGQNGHILTSFWCGHLSLLFFLFFFASASLALHLFSEPNYT